MRRITASIIIGLVLCAINVPLLHADEADSQFPIDVQVSGESADADGNDYIVFSLFVYGWYCVTTGTVSQTTFCPDGTESTAKVGRPGHNIGIYASGSSNIFDGTKTSGTNRYVTADDNGEAQFNLSSAKNEVKTLQFTDNLWGTPYAGATSISVTFGKPDARGTNSAGTNDTASGSSGSQAETNNTQAKAADDTKKDARSATNESAAPKHGSELLVRMAIGASMLVFGLLLGLAAKMISRHKNKPTGYNTPLPVESAYQHNPYHIGKIALNGALAATAPAPTQQYVPPSAGQSPPTGSPE